jgi:geranylgeranyl diphosphate synthase type II
MRSFLPRHEPRSYLWDLVADYPTRPGLHLPARLCLAMVEALGGSPERAVDTATALDLNHDAVMIQRDISDQLKQRRGRPTLQQMHGLPLAINAAATLGLVSLRPLMANFHTLGAKPAVDLLHLYLDASRLAMEGLAIEQEWRRRGIFEISDEDYLSMIYRERGLLRVLLPLRIAAHLMGRNPELVDRLGCALAGGLAILEDLEDLSREDSACLTQGRRTLPLIQGYRHSDAPTRRLIREWFRPNLPTPRADHRTHMLQRLAGSGALSNSRRLAAELLRQAALENHRLLQSLPPSRGGRFLARLPDTLGARLNQVCRQLPQDREGPRTW